MSGEFNLIEKYFVNRQPQRKDVLLAAGDDCALVKAPGNVEIAISTDTLVAGTHFLAEANPAWVAHKALASNISDLAAMGATPAWVSFALTMPEIDEAWLTPFCDSFFKLADYFGIQLIGGDTTKGPLSLTLTVQGFVPEGRALRRDGAKVGDWIYVTGNLGDSKAGLEVLLNPEQNRAKPYAAELEERHYVSAPRVLAGQALVNLASSAIDISDGVIADLKHILKRSQVGASIDVSTLPISPELRQFAPDITSAQQYALTSGEEYELCFTVPEENKGSLESALSHTGTKVTCIGQIRPVEYFELHNNGEPLSWNLTGYDHFKVN
ncbi:thiamine-phosphate kinase [Vibrio sp. 10N.222.51.C8]|uniref:thiamine-phosphate kinase n=1 Tax=unclassified Vibrio TaxID=2614977 RepID=UPI000C864292|nr:MULTISPECIES: thiamine-phosphate kinase [unclassified Vibrio]PMK28959.1 thiamine-phosphate kinase [Vibrio sp. 10N.261.54.C3]PMO00341.1 thiamine-phosphate kinase [Vibrio sp. 10N.222.55.C12]PMO17398.1 thiamine-phosphate kinase [Vibrio sp. 10N.222.54.F10]PMO25557.1 thiamine-phosphate kinase [Vibrio sp. 10N.222.54.B6]TKF41578.1 thiamine-phosphate kinase [Vibrio sp. F13]